MKITKTQLRQIIKEEVENTLQEITPGSPAAQGAQRRAEISPILLKMGVRNTPGSKEAFFKHAEAIYRNRYEMMHSMAATGGKQFGEGDISDREIKDAFLSSFKRSLMDGKNGKLNNVELSEDEANLVLQYLMNNNDESKTAQYLKKQLSRG
jgi:hypothetical protein